ncbi:hypothetical protein [Chryseobacterium taichungense]|uniref:hypothetical protein n=1 Tax=Chryseobacterium taichungense TaxID=295069 RepID=UPI0028A6F8AE|nr:hypothetical protein [Chryseobacterium taichungense]
MKEDQIIRDFNLADSVLKQKADKWIALTDRDIDYLGGLNFIIYLFFIILFNPKLHYA